MSCCTVLSPFREKLGFTHFLGKVIILFHTGKPRYMQFFISAAFHIWDWKSYFFLGPILQFILCILNAKIWCVSLIFTSLSLTYGSLNNAWTQGVRGPHSITKTFFSFFMLLVKKKICLMAWNGFNGYLLISSLKCSKQIRPQNL